MTALAQPHLSVSTVPNSPRRRPDWVELAIVIVIAAGLLDLLFTARAMAGPGMLEVNPLARALASHSVGALIGFKLLMISVNAVPLWLWRDRRIVKFASIVSLAIMLLLMGQWALWFQTWHELGPDVWGALENDPRWVRLGA